MCLTQRGTNSFAQKVQNCEVGGGMAAVIYNNAQALFSGTLGGTATSIPSVAASGATGSVLLGLTGQNATVTTGPGNDSFYDGTSMATPHVAGVAALVWSGNTTVPGAAAPAAPALSPQPSAFFVRGIVPAPCAPRCAGLTPVPGVAVLLIGFRLPGTVVQRAL